MSNVDWNNDFHELDLRKGLLNSKFRSKSPKKGTSSKLSKYAGGYADAVNWEAHCDPVAPKAATEIAIVGYGTSALAAPTQLSSLVRRSALDELFEKLVAGMLVATGSARSMRYEEPPLPEPSVEVDPASHFRESIQAAYADPDAKTGLRRIARVWERIEAIAQLAQARSRILIGKLEPIPLPAEPDWLGPMLDELANSTSGPPAKSTISSARSLLRFVATELQDGLRPVIEAGPLGRISIDWERDDRRLQWLVAAPDLPWPGVSLMTMARVGLGRDARRESRTLFNAFDARDQLQAFLTHDPAK